MTTRPMDELVVRAAVVAAAQALAPRGLTTGTSGNVSARCARDGVAGFVITPSAMPSPVSALLALRTRKEKHATHEKRKAHMKGGEYTYIKGRDTI